MKRQLQRKEWSQAFLIFPTLNPPTRLDPENSTNRGGVQRGKEWKKDSRRAWDNQIQVLAVGSWPLTHK